jgi:cobalt/nickel transport protein
VNLTRRSIWLLLLLVGALVAVPLLLAGFHFGGGHAGSFQGVDDQFSALVTGLRPGYRPWVHSVWTPPSSEVESFLFASQAAFGAGVLGYCLGVARRSQPAANAAVSLKRGRRIMVRSGPVVIRIRGMRGSRSK